MVTEEALESARIIWDYHCLKQDAEPAEVIVALGTNDLRVAEYAADLYLRGFGKLLVCTGGIAHQNDLLATPWRRSEAEMYAESAIARGVPRECIVLEPKATNTAENLRFSRALIPHASSIVIAVKPFMRRRTWATLAVEWTDVKATLASPRMTLDEYFTDELPAEKILHIMMGDLQRIWIYGERGWLARQHVPDAVMLAYERLKRLGFTKHLL